MGTDRDWKRWGESDPYFAVYSAEKFRATAITEAAKTEFFASGEEHVARILHGIEGRSRDEFVLRTALDYGCGVGRLVIPLARRAAHVTGVDISCSMLAEAWRNCGVAGVSNVAFVESDDSLSRVHDKYDLVHSCIVFQHIPWQRGHGILLALADRVAPEGYLVVQILSGYVASRTIRGLVRLRYFFPPVNWIRNIAKNRPIFEPAMQLHVYNIGILRSELERRGFVCDQIDTTWSGFRSTFLYARQAG